MALAKLKALYKREIEGWEEGNITCTMRKFISELY